MIPSQMLKGTLEGCILAVISQQETYGYEISQTLRGHSFGDISEGTVYPLLPRLEKTASSSPLTMILAAAPNANIIP